MTVTKAVELALPDDAIQASTLDEFRAIMIREISNRGWDSSLYKYRVPDQLVDAFNAQMAVAVAAEQGITLHSPIAGVGAVAGLITRFRPQKDGESASCTTSSRRSIIAKSVGAIAIATAFLTFGKVRRASAQFCDDAPCYMCICNFRVGCGSTGTLDYTICDYYCDCSHICFEQVTSGCTSCPGPSC